MSNEKIEVGQIRMCCINKEYYKIAYMDDEGYYYLHWLKGTTTIEPAGFTAEELMQDRAISSLEKELM